MLKGPLVKLMVGPGELRGIFQHDSLILLCEYENVKLLKKMSLVQGEQTNKIDIIFPLTELQLQVFTIFPSSRKIYFHRTSLAGSFAQHQPKPEGVRAPCVYEVTPSMNFGGTTRCLWSGELER